MTVLNEIPESAGRGNYNSWTPIQQTDLFLCRHATDNSGNGNVRVFGGGKKMISHLNILFLIN